MFKLVAQLVRASTPGLIMRNVTGSSPSLLDTFTNTDYLVLYEFYLISSPHRSLAHGDRKKKDCHLLTKKKRIYRRRIYIGPGLYVLY